jgi:hypothetical protein
VNGDLGVGRRRSIVDAREDEDTVRIIWIVWVWR